MVAIAQNEGSIKNKAVFVFFQRYFVNLLISQII